jgi:hypothetical protein
MPDSNQLADQFLAATRHALSEGRRKIEHCVNQLTAEQLWWRPRPEMNSIANLMLHLSGNIRQWIVSGIGGAADIRNRPQEFADRSQRPNHELLALLNAAVAEADSAISKLTGDDLTTSRRIQGFDTNVTAALINCISHFTGHTQEIIHLSREQLGEKYTFDFVPKGPAQASAGAASK